MQFNKNRTVCLSQSNARKYIRQYKLVNQRNVPVTKIVVPEKSLVGWRRLVGEHSWLFVALPMSSCNFGCPRNFPQPIISKLDSMQSCHKLAHPVGYRWSVFTTKLLLHRYATSKPTAVMAPMRVNVPSRVVPLTVGTSVIGMSLIPLGKSVPCRIHG